MKEMQRLVVKDQGLRESSWRFLLPDVFKQREGSIIFANRLVSTTVHGYHYTPTSTPATFKETARSETSLPEPTTSGGV